MSKYSCMWIYEAIAKCIVRLFYWQRCYAENLMPITGQTHVFYDNKLTNCALTLVDAQAPQAQNTWYMQQLVYIENCMGKSPIVKKCVNNYLIWNKVFLPQMCRELVSCADLKPFWRRLVELFETVTPPTKRRQNGFKIGTRDKFATHLR